MTYHCKVDGRTGEIAREWTGKARSLKNDSYPVSFNGQTNFFGSSTKSAQEARDRALAAYSQLVGV